MRRALLVAVLVLSSVAAVAQLKPRPDAFPPQDAPVASKAVTMASDISQMAGWDRYPTYETYLAMMQRWAPARVRRSPSSSTPPPSMATR